MKLVSQRVAEQAEVQGDTPALRLVSLLEHVASRDHLHTLQGLAEATGLPKPTLHRMLQQLEAAGLLQREGDGRHWGTGSRLRRLVDEVGESCNITAMSGGEVLYLDRVETAAPLRFYLQPGSRVPVHCSASGKVFLSQMTPAQRQRLLGATPLEACTPRTTTDLGALEQELRRVKTQGCGFDHEEFLPGLTCAAVPVPAAEPKGRSSLCIALQGPTMRLNRDKLQSLLPALRAAAQALTRLEEGAPASEQRKTS